MALVSFLAARTARVRIGMAVTVLPLVHPLRIAEEVATVDHLSRGRFDLGIGRSGAASTYDVLGIPIRESQARFEEALAILREAWKGEPLLLPGPVPPDHEHRGDAAAVPAAAPAAADGGELAGDLSLGRAGRTAAVRRGARPEHPGARASTSSPTGPRGARPGHAGSGDACASPVYAAPTEEAAARGPRENIMYFFRRHTELARARLGRAGAGPTARIQSRVAELAALSYDRILETRVAFGTAASLVRAPRGRARRPRAWTASSRS